MSFSRQKYAWVILSFIQEEDATFTTGSTDAHTAAQNGDITLLKTIAKRDPSQLHVADSNGWKVSYAFTVYNH